jgi:hypothetical protein
MPDRSANGLLADGSSTSKSATDNLDPLGQSNPPHCVMRRIYRRAPSNLSAARNNKHDADRK